MGNANIDIKGSTIIGTNASCRLCLEVGDGGRAGCPVDRSAIIAIGDDSAIFGSCAVRSRECGFDCCIDAPTTDGVAIGYVNSVSCAMDNGIMAISRRMTYGINCLDKSGCITVGTDTGNSNACSFATPTNMARILLMIGNSVGKSKRVSLTSSAEAGTTCGGGAAPATRTTFTTSTGNSNRVALTSSAEVGTTCGGGAALD